MDDSDSFNIRCDGCGTGERLSFRDMETRELIRCAVCGTVRGMGKEALLDACREAAKFTRQRLS